jgi:hypothetical protein
MTTPKKPEWIHIADTDNSSSVRKVSKTLPAIALGSALMIIGAGVVFAQTEIKTPAIAVESALGVQSANSVQPVLENTPTSRATTSLRVQNVVTQEPTAPVLGESQAIAPKAPGLQMPTGGGDDDDDDDDRDHRGDDEDDEDDEDDD